MFGSERTRTIRTETVFDRGRTTSARARTVQNFQKIGVCGRTTTFQKGFRKRHRCRNCAEPMILLSVIALHTSDQYYHNVGFCKSSYFSQNILFNFRQKGLFEPWSIGFEHQCVRIGSVRENFQIVRIGSDRIIFSKICSCSFEPEHSLFAHLYHGVKVFWPWKYFWWQIGPQ